MVFIIHATILKKIGTSSIMLSSRFTKYDVVVVVAETTIRTHKYCTPLLVRWRMMIFDPHSIKNGTQQHRYYVSKERFLYNCRPRHQPLCSSKRLLTMLMDSTTGRETFVRNTTRNSMTLYPKQYQLATPPRRLDRYISSRSMGTTSQNDTGTTKTTLTNHQTTIALQQSIIQRNPKIVLTKYEIAELEEHIYRMVTTVVRDPVLGHSLSSLQWLQKRILVSYSYSRDDDNNNNLESVKDDNDIDKKTSPLGIVIALKMVLRLPSLLYPQLHELQNLLQQAVQYQTRQWYIGKQKMVEDIITTDHHNNNSTSIMHPTFVVHLDTVPTIKPIPIMSRIVEDAQELLHNLGPGLTSVAHCVAVYSCKVR
jgi:hypothetical protein